MTSSTPAYRLFYLGTALFCLLRWLIVPALPLGNDEAYYWDWGRQLMLSYFDHPPGVAWVAHLGNLIDSAPRGSRWLLPLLHAIGAVIQLQILRLCVSRPSASQVLTLFIICQVVPYSFVGGLLLMPDSGLLVWLPLMAYLLISLSLAPAGERLPWPKLIAVGAVLGLAFNFKYHGLVIGGCGILWLLWQRRQQFFRDLPGWLLALGAFLIAAFPVLYWNVANDFISFRFQTDHGFGGLKFSLTPLIQLIVADTLLLSPLVIYLLFRSLFGGGEAAEPMRRTALMAMGLPLLLLILGLAPFKEILPHWVVPCFWVMMPLLAIPVVGKVWQLGTALYSAVLVAVLLLVTINPTVQRFAFSQSSNKPSGLGELTVWPYVAKKLEAMNATAPVHFTGGGDWAYPDCALAKDKLPVIASVRWYWVAQLAGELPGQPQVISLDPNHLSYYHFRDDLSRYKGCPVVVIGQTKHTSVEKLATAISPPAGPFPAASQLKVSAIRHETFVPEFHRDRETIVVWGVLN